MRNLSNFVEEWAMNCPKENLRETKRNDWSRISRSENRSRIRETSVPFSSCENGHSDGGDASNGSHRMAHSFVGLIESEAENRRSRGENAFHNVFDSPVF
jgi:hypothetical protein